MHTIALTSDPSRCDKVRTEWSILWQICSEVHFFPFEFFSQTVLSRKTKFSQMPSLNKINLAVAWFIVHLLRVTFFTTKHRVRVKSPISAIMSQQESVFLAVEPSGLSREFYDLILVK